MTARTAAAGRKAFIGAPRTAGRRGDGGQPPRIPAPARKATKKRRDTNPRPPLRGAPADAPRSGEDTPSRRGAADEGILLLDDRLVAVVAIRRGVGVVGEEDEPAVAEAYLVARPQHRRAGDPLAVDERAVLGRRVVDLARVGG